MIQLDDAKMYVLIEPWGMSIPVILIISVVLFYLLLRFREMNNEKLFIVAMTPVGLVIAYYVHVYRDLFMAKGIKFICDMLCLS